MFPCVRACLPNCNRNLVLSDLTNSWKTLSVCQSCIRADEANQQHEFLFTLIDCRPSPMSTASKPRFIDKKIACIIHSETVNSSGGFRSYRGDGTSGSGVRKFPAEFRGGARWESGAKPPEAGDIF